MYPREQLFRQITVEILKNLDFPEIVQYCKNVLTSTNFAHFFKVFICRNICTKFQVNRMCISRVVVEGGSWVGHFRPLQANI